VLSCLEFIQPFPDQAVRLLKERGFRRVAVMPFLLGQGKHATLELDEMLTELRAQSPQVQIYLAEGLGADPHLADLVVQRVLEMRGLLPSPNGKDHTAGVLLVKAGTQTRYDDCRWLEELGQLVEKRLGPGYAVAAAQSHYGDPTMESAAKYLVEKRQASAVLCVPYLFFPGLILKRNVLGGMDRLRREYPDVPMAVAPPLGVDDRVVAVAAERVRGLWERAEDATR
jgi:sirohydrochlorin ferrochelatase